MAALRAARFSILNSQFSIRRSGALLALIVLSACASTRSDHEAPLVPGTPLDQVHAVRELMRVRATHGDRTESFKAQMLLEPATRRIELTAYTPLNTSAMTLFADGDRVTFLNNIQRTQWQGSASELAGSLGLFASRP